MRAGTVRGVARASGRPRVLIAGGATWPNEPSGWTLIADTTWESAEVGAWSSGTRDGWSIKFVDATRSAAIETVADSTIGEGRAVTHIYPASHTGGGGGEVYRAIGGTYRQIYVGMYVRLSADFYGHGGSAINKLAYVRVDNSGTEGLMWVEYRFAGASEPMELDLDTPRRIRYWVDGTLWIDDTAFAGGSAGRISEVTLSGILGGVGAASNPAEQRMQYDRVRVVVN